MLREGLLFLSGSRAARKLLTGTPITRSMSRRFVPGETVDELVAATRDANAQGLKVTANYLGESVTSREPAIAAADRYIEVLDRIHGEGLDANVSLKFTQMGQDIDAGFLAENLGRVLEKAKEQDTFIRFDMESSAYTDQTLEAFEELWSSGWRNIGVVLQSYLFRTAADVVRMVDLGARVRLCKGAYAEPDTVAWQERRKVDQSYVAIMKELLSHGNYPAIATHDDDLIAATLRYVEAQQINKSRFEFQMLYGVRRDLQQELVEQGYNVRVYVPFGEAWYPYLMRRLAERPANLMFMVSSVFKESPLNRGRGNGSRGSANGSGGPRVTSGPGAAALTSESQAGFLRVTEIFHSIQGESTWAGLPCTFVRLTGCPLRCVWCDTAYAFHGGERMDLDEILDQVNQIDCRLVEITGGEPLIHPGAFTLAGELVRHGYTVLVETSGAVDVSGLDPRVHRIMDLKCPGSGEADKNLWSNLDVLTSRDEVKFVVADMSDYDWARTTIRDRGLDLRVRAGELRALLMSPVWETASASATAGKEAEAPFLQKLSEQILVDRLPVRLQVQLHKLIWGPDKAGV